MPIMQKITILGLAVAISMVSCIVPVAEAEPIPSPYQQVRDGVPIGEIVCAGDRMLRCDPQLRIEPSMPIILQICVPKHATFV